MLRFKTIFGIEFYKLLQVHFYLFLGFGTLNSDLQRYAAQRMLMAMNLPHITDTMKCVGSYVISEFSEHLLPVVKDPQKLFDAINKHFQNANNKSKAMMLNGFAKLAIKY